MDGTMINSIRLIVVAATILTIMECQRNHREVFIHFDLKGAPPRPTYFKQLLTAVHELGANGVLIEWEDMFPYQGALSSIKNGNAYTVDETFDILQHANSLDLSVIPLVQTVGHLEWILKTKEFANLRENARYPMVACIGNNQTLSLILDAIHQVMAMHSTIRVPYLHIGADEVFQIGQCDADRKVLPVKYANNTKRLIFDYVRTIVTNITQTFRKTKVLMWFDEFKNTDPELIKEYELDRSVIPVVWKYSTNLDKDLPATMWQDLAHSFTTIWGGSAFKGADGPNRFWNRMKNYVENNKQWYLQAEAYSDLFHDFHGFFLTGWQRYDHFASLCELMPVSMASLAINIRLVQSYAITDSEAEIILRTLKCPSNTTIIQLISGDDKCHFVGEQLIPCCFRPVLSSPATELSAGGFKVRDSIRDFIQLKQQYDNTAWLHWREAAYLQRSQIYLNASNPFYVDAIGNSYRRWLSRLDKIIERLKSSMSHLFYKDVFAEFATDYIKTFHDELKERLACVEIIDARKTYPARPWFRR